SAIDQSLWQHGYAKTPPVLTPDECAELIGMYGERERFRSRVEMARFRFGVGDYQYFGAPLPPLVDALRVHAYPSLAEIANRWEVALGAATRHPSTLAALQALCREHGQTKPTPLLLHYEAGGYNCLHQDLYGDVVFPLQLTCFLSRPGVDYDGGEFLLVEQRPLAHSRRSESSRSRTRARRLPRPTYERGRSRLHAGGGARRRHSGQACIARGARTRLPGPDRPAGWDAARLHHRVQGAGARGRRAKRAGDRVWRSARPPARRPHRGERSDRRGRPPHHRRLA